MNRVNKFEFPPPFNPAAGLTDDQVVSILSAGLVAAIDHVVGDSYLHQQVQYLCGAPESQEAAAVRKWLRERGITLPAGAERLTRIDLPHLLTFACEEHWLPAPVQALLDTISVARGLALISTQGGAPFAHPLQLALGLGKNKVGATPLDKMPDWRQQCSLVAAPCCLPQGQAAPLPAAAAPAALSYHDLLRDVCLPVGRNNVEGEIGRASNILRYYLGVQGGSRQPGSIRCAIEGLQAAVSQLHLHTTKLPTWCVVVLLGVVDCMRC